MPTRHDEVAAGLQLALLLEVSAYPKPGNVHRTRDFDRTRFEHFLASAIALGRHFRLAALSGRRFAESSKRRMETRIGERIRSAVEACSAWQSGGNTSLGAILLLMPIAYAAGMIPRSSDLTAQDIRKNLRKVVTATTSDDAAETYQAIVDASPGGMGKVPKLDVNDSASIAEIRKRNLSLLDIFRISAKYDTISREWVNNFSITFDVGLQFLLQELRLTGDINTATINTYLRILSKVPDTLIARKQGIKRAREISSMAKEVLERGGMRTAMGRRAAAKMDVTLRQFGHESNPGTTADLTASTLSILLLEGYRP
jgi:triphosphoribosyl-dephospho-CoA synthase